MKKLRNGHCFRLMIELLNMRSLLSHSSTLQHQIKHKLRSSSEEYSRPKSTKWFWIITKANNKSDATQPQGFSFRWHLQSDQITLLHPYPIPNEWRRNSLVIDIVLNTMSWEVQEWTSWPNLDIFIFNIKHFLLREHRARGPSSKGCPSFCTSLFVHVPVLFLTY